jgi:Fe2+ transport system protein FeoA
LLGQILGHSTLLRFGGQTAVSLIYQTTMTINQAPMNTKLIVRSFAIHEDKEFSDIESRLMHLGFMNGEVIRITRKAPLFKEPLLVEVRGRSVALSSEEASLVSVEVLK